MALIGLNSTKVNNIILTKSSSYRSLQIDKHGCLELATCGCNGKQFFITKPHGKFIIVTATQPMTPAETSKLAVETNFMTS